MLCELIMCCFPLVEKEVSVKKNKRKSNLGQRNILKNTFSCSADLLSQMNNSSGATMILIKQQQPSVSGAEDNAFIMRISCG